MLERFTARARRVTGEEARRRGHGFVGTEHVIFGMVRDGDGLAIHALRRLGLDPRALGAQLEGALSGARPDAPADAGALQFTPELKQALLLTAEEARDLGHAWIGTEDILPYVPFSEGNLSLIKSSRWLIRP